MHLLGQSCMQVSIVNVMDLWCASHGVNMTLLWHVVSTCNEQKSLFYGLQKQEWMGWRD